MSPQPFPSFPILVRDDHNITGPALNLTALNDTLLTNSTTNSTQPIKDEPKTGGGGFPGFLIAVIIIGVIAGLAFLALIFYRRRASHQRAFGSAPGPSLDGAKSSLSSLWYKIKNPRDRSTSAGFEGISAGRAQHRGRALDPDEAWDSRVGHEADAYYEDTELQGTSNTSYLGAGGVARGNTGGMPAENPFGDEHATGRNRSQNPFGDEHAPARGSSIRSVSPRPVIDTKTAAPGSGGPAQISPTRRSLFKEEV